MKRIIPLLTVFFLLALPTCAKKVTVTIDGTVSPSQTTLYLIINEDIANAQLIPIQDAHFSITVEVEKDAFIRLHDYKEWPERSVFVLIPDSRHITIDWRNGTIEGSPMSKRLQMACKQIRDASPEGFHIDVFSDDPEAWASAREQERAIRERMMHDQLEAIEKVMKENKRNNIPAWIVYCYYPQLEMPYRLILEGPRGKWCNHPILKLLKRE
ncbi:MAG: hypothetical protein IKX22_12485 [Prevotella sp.]|nr:hypothetical protein [Prevotella sp.]